jgi:peptidoglycan/xylan/chitin deacetylase (PgdA/CDA1 family)
MVRRTLGRWVRRARSQPPAPRRPHREVRRLHHFRDEDWRTEDRVVAITFDDGPFPDRTPEVLEALRTLGIPATFFLVGRRADRAPGLVRRIVAEGHLVANHAYNHQNLTKVTPERARREIRAGRASIAHHSGVDTPYFRPPFSARDDEVRAIVDDVGQILVHWSVSVNDGSASSEDIVAGVLDKLEPGAIVLLHELPQTVAALPGIVAGAHERGYRFVTLDGSGAADASASGAAAGSGHRRVTSVTSTHTAGLVIDATDPGDQVLLCTSEDATDVAYAVWGAGRSGAALILTTGGKLSVPYRAQIERLDPDRLVRIGAAVGLLDDDEGLPSEGHDHDLARALLDGVDLVDDRWLVVDDEDAATLLVAASTAARIGAGLLVVDGEVDPVAELTARGAREVVLVGGVDASVRDGLGDVAVREVAGDDPCVLSAALAEAHPPGTAPVLIEPRFDHHTVAAAVEAARRGSALLLITSERTDHVERASDRDGQDGEVTVVGGHDELPDAVVDAVARGVSRPANG